MDAKLVYVDNRPHWMMPEGSFVRAENNDTPWDIVIQTPDGYRSLKK